jgi:hypothetical protein
MKLKIISACLTVFFACAAYPSDNSSAYYVIIVPK